MGDFWINFQGKAGDLFSYCLGLIPGSPTLKLLVFSCIFGVILVWTYQFVSFQKGLKKIKQKISAVAVEPFIFRDSARISLMSPLRLVCLGFGYLGLTIPALALMALPVVWIMGLWNQVVGYEYPAHGEQVSIAIEASNAKTIRSLQLATSEASNVLTPLVRSYHQSLAWAGLKFGSDHSPTLLALTANNATVQIPLAGSSFIPVLTQSPFGRLLFPGSSIELPAGIRQISIDYPSHSVSVLGIKVPWAVLFLLVSMASGLVFAKVFKIAL